VGRTKIDLYKLLDGMMKSIEVEKEEPIMEVEEADETGVDEEE